LFFCICEKVAEEIVRRKKIVSKNLFIGKDIFEAGHKVNNYAFLQVLKKRFMFFMKEIPPVTNV